jgi:hypothetical protein
MMKSCKFEDEDAQPSQLWSFCFKPLSRLSSLIASFEESVEILPAGRGPHLHQQYLIFNHFLAPHDNPGRLDALWRHVDRLRAPGIQLPARSGQLDEVVKAKSLIVHPAQRTKGETIPRCRLNVLVVTERILRQSLLSKKGEAFPVHRCLPHYRTSVASFDKI